jgi:hypothetical protein
MEEEEEEEEEEEDEEENCFVASTLYQSCQIKLRTCCEEI